MYFMHGLTPGIAIKNARNSCKLFATSYNTDSMPISMAKVSHKLDFKGRTELGSAVDVIIDTLNDTRPPFTK